MPLLPTKLGDALAKIEPKDNEPEAISAFAEAFEDYFYGATATGPAVPGSLSAARAAMEGAMTGLSVSGLASIQLGITAFWGIACASAASVWPGVLSASPPPGLGGIAAAVGAVVPLSAASKLDGPSAWRAMALAIHPCMLGGIAVLPPPAAPMPIL